MSALAYQRLIDALERHGSSGNGQRYQCPVHDDGTPSLSIADKPDRVLTHCHAGCDTLEVLETIGLDWSDLFDEPQAGKGWTTAALRGLGAKANVDGRVDLGSVRYKLARPPGRSRLP